MMRGWIENAQKGGRCDFRAGPAEDDPIFRILAERDLPGGIAELVRVFLEGSDRDDAFGDEKLGDIGRQLVGDGAEGEGDRVPTLGSIVKRCIENLERRVR